MTTAEAFWTYCLLVGIVTLVFKLATRSNKTPFDILRQEQPQVDDEDRKQSPNAYNTSIMFKNLVIKSDYNTEFSEIDALIVSPYGIFCIEAKQWQGCIFGDAKSTKWTQCKYNGVKERRINPIRQNYGHIKSLEKLLGSKLKSADIHNFVLFSEGAELRVDDPRVLSSKKQLKDILCSHTKQIYSMQEYDSICKILAHESMLSSERLPRHIENLKTNPQYS